MTEYHLAIGDRTYSSWSLRGWLMFAGFGIDVTVHSARMYSPAFRDMLDRFGGGPTVPAMRTGDIIVADTLAMAETLAEAHPRLWPADPVARGRARSMVAEMHAGFGALREACPMNLRWVYRDFAPSDAVRADLNRIAHLWAAARADFGDGGPWLFGDYSLADVFYAPVATRIVTYDLPVSEEARAYAMAHLHDRCFRRWRAMGLAENYVQPGYDLDLPRTVWPGPSPVRATPVTGVPPINATCPFSGKPVAEDACATIDGRVIGFCNAFCRDKTVADPAAWPEVMDLLRSG